MLLFNLLLLEIFYYIQLHAILNGTPMNNNIFMRRQDICYTSTPKASLPIMAKNPMHIPPKKPEKKKHNKRHRHCRVLHT